MEDRGVLAADFNEDATVDSLDLRNWQFGYGMAATSSQSQGDGDVDGRDFLAWQRNHGPQQNNLIAYRPQSVHPLMRRSMIRFPKNLSENKTKPATTLGPGIRVNQDDDNNSGVADGFESGIEIERENDLIEVKVDRLGGQGDLVLVPGSNLALYFDHDKQTPVPLDETMIRTEPLPFQNNTITVFVEWQFSIHGQSNLSLVDLATPTTLDTIRFHTFRTLVVVFGGNTQDPTDTDGDGSIGDPVGSPFEANREGIFDVAQFLYVTGWDVLAFDEEDWDHSDDVPYTEARNAVQQRFVAPKFGGGVAIMGFSHGGGATHDMIERLWNDDDIITTFGVFLDAVVHDGLAPENDWPDAVFYLLNIYEVLVEAPPFGGADIDDTEVLSPAILEEVNTTADSGWDPSLNHFSIDDDPQVQQLNHSKTGTTA